MDIALVGDSIRLSYQPHVAAALAGRSRVWGPVDNCQSSRHLRANLDQWLLNDLAAPTLVHINAGLHDVRRAAERDWSVQVPLDEYSANLEWILDRIIASPATVGLAVATSTPVDEARHREGDRALRRSRDVDAYNDVLGDLASRKGIVVNDLHGTVSRMRPDALSDDGVHLTTAAQTKLGHQVAAFLMGLEPAT